MRHGLFLVKELEDKDHLHALQARNAIRASINVVHGIVQGIGVVKHEQPMAYMTSTSGLCPVGAICDLYEVLPILSVYFGGEPAAVMFSVLFEVPAGNRADFAEGVLRVAADHDGVEVAAGHLLGPGRYGAIAEVRGDESEPVLRALLGLTDIAAAKSAHVLHTEAAGIRGKGSDRVSGRQ
ncbi:MAG: hypothetical protein ACXVGH_02830 [Mycobacteriales bacterium]